MPTTPSLDPAWLDREYNNRALVPEHVDIFARWARDSAVARQAPGALIDVPYGSGAGEMLDIFPAEGGGAAPAPVLFFIHGGWWRSLDKADHSFVAPPFTRKGACVVMPNYALCPAVTIPHITLQMVQALAWTFRHIAAHGGDPRRITVIGHSAGGHLASMLMNCSWQLVGADLPADLPRSMGAPLVLGQSRDARLLRRALGVASSLATALPRLARQFDGELVVEAEGEPSFDALQMRIHPAESRIRRLAAETPARLVVFDLLLGPDGRSLLDETLADRRAGLATSGVATRPRACAGRVR